METNDRKDRRDDIFSRNVRAGKRTYFFDVKATRADDYYLTITESTKRFNDDGSFHYEKHRLFLYKEDFEKFSNCLAEVTDYIITEKGTEPIRGESNFRNNNGAAQSANKSNATDTAPAVSVSEDVDDGKTNEEVNMVEDAHEKAISEDSSEEKEVDGNVEVPSNGSAEKPQSDVSDNAEAEINPIDIRSNRE